MGPRAPACARTQGPPQFRSCTAISMISALCNAWGFREISMTISSLPNPSLLPCLQFPHFCACRTFLGSAPCAHIPCSVPGRLHELNDEAFWLSLRLHVHQALWQLRRPTGADQTPGARVMEQESREERGLRSFTHSQG